MSKKVEPSKRIPNADKRERFCQEYIIDLVGKYAYLRAGYKVNDHTAEQKSSILLRDPWVQQRIAELKKERGERTKVTADRVILELERLAMLDPKDIVHLVSPAQIALLPEDIRRAIVGWGYDKAGNFSVKLAKEKAIELLGRHHGLFKDRVEVEDKTNYAEALRKARERSQQK